MAGPLLGRRMLLVAAVEESPRPSHLSGSAGRDPKGWGGIRCLISRLSLCHRTLGPWTRLVSIVVWGSVPARRRSSPVDCSPRGGSPFLAGDALQDDQSKCRSVRSVGGWAWTRFRFEGRFSSVSGLAHYTILHRAWRSREHCPDGSLPSSRQGVADQESVDVNDAYCFLHLQPIGHPRICCLWRLEPALPFRFVSGVLACVGVGRRWLYQSRSENLVGTQPWTNNYHNGSTYCSTGQRTDNQDRHPV